MTEGQEGGLFTDAGISANSGIPTYREKLSGIWAGYDPRDLETAKAFRENRRWYGGGIYGGGSESLKQSQMRHILR
nr:Sir2 family NAD-dependent protein deacetylase [Pseudomonas brassicacearum]